MATTINKTIASGRADYAYKCVKETIDKLVEEINNTISKTECEIGEKVIKFLWDKDVLKKVEEDIKDESCILLINSSKEKLEELVKNHKKILGEYKSYVKKIPMYIKNNGLAATFAFVLSKNKPAYQLIYKQTENWLMQNRLIQVTDLMVGILSTDSYHYRIITNEVLALFNWMRRFVDGLIEDEEN